MRREKVITKCLITNRYGASSPGSLFSTIHWDLAIQYFNKKAKGTLGPFWSGCARYSYRKKLTKNYIFTARCEHFTTGREIDKEVVDEPFHAEEVGNKYF